MKINLLNYKNAYHKLTKKFNNEDIKYKDLLKTFNEIKVDNANSKIEIDKLRKENKII